MADIPVPFLGSGSAATNRRATIEVLLETGCFCVVRAEELSEDNWDDEKRTPCLQINPDHLVPGGYEYGYLFLQVGGVSNVR
jgi:hypothetical protein